MGETTSHKGQKHRGLKEFADIFEVEISFGAQGSIKGEFGVAKAELSLDFGTKRIGFEDGKGYLKSTIGAEISMEILNKIKGLGFKLGMKKEKEGFPAPAMLDQFGNLKVNEKSGYLNYLSKTKWEISKGVTLPKNSKIGGDGDFKIGFGGAIIGGFDFNVNISEAIDFLKYAGENE